MNILILLRHSGIWESAVTYERYKSDGIVVGENISFMNLISAIAAELGIDESKKNIEIRYVVEVCHSNDCCWKLKASIRKNSETFIVRYFNSEHTCPLRDRILSKVQAIVGFVSGATAPKLGNHKRKHTPNDIIDDIRETYGVEISYEQAWRAKERALELIRGKTADAYRNMPRYIYMLETVYQNSYIRMHKSEYNEFMYLFISLSPMMRGFEFCKPVVVVHASHLSGAYRGTFVSASTLDGAGCILPLAYGIIDTKEWLFMDMVLSTVAYCLWRTELLTQKNDCSWTWFFQQFKNTFGDREKCVLYLTEMKA
ncbi:uncharacterized protein LOC107013352 [Solanum pennellii]|uniref:Uncharacterized protein LOC107013352 n=1 Tax=Solanum pennellii TaxID=28526 RepID=A0ABM1GBP2_SOLPN|nr:uncharacterized protein LOC107013352 [Solanum pennellii]